MEHGSTGLGEDYREAHAFYARTLSGLNSSGVAFLVGGAYALDRYTSIQRHTKDLDLFIRGEDLEAILDVLAGLGCRTEVTFPHWLAKAHRGSHFLDIIFSSGNGLAAVDDAWFQHSVPEHVIDIPVRLVPVEEMIWQKAFVMERERFDGADVAHLLRGRCATLDWPRLLSRFGEAHARVLLAHLVLFGYIYPDEKSTVPGAVLRALIDGLDAEPSAPPEAEPLCRGPILSRAQYLPDLDEWGYKDARLKPLGRMSAQEIAHWTAAIERCP